MTTILRLLGGRSEWLICLGVFAALLLVVLPLAFNGYFLNLLGRYLALAFVAIGLVMCWGYGGMLSLGQGVFFGLGGYAMAMFLKLEASTPEATAKQSTPGIPDFMDWNQLTALPWWWEPFNSFSFTLAALLLIPAAVAYVFGYALFKRRVSGVYFAIVTLSLAAAMSILIVGQQGYTGGANGITDFQTLLGWDITTDSARYVIYYICVFLLLVCIVLGQWILSSRAGRVLIAVRDEENRVRFSGYSVEDFKIFVFMVAAVFSAIGGAMFALQARFISPSQVGIGLSVELVVLCAVGGRFSLLGAAFGALLIKTAEMYLSDLFPQLWTILFGLILLVVVLAFPKGLAGLYELARDYALDHFGSNQSHAALEEHADKRSLHGREEGFLVRAKRILGGIR
ncbi:urea ABC transporter permease subunit UrtC [Halovibrio salipaludis]|uniref:Urea ABC transporter permease subunit UrtC n=1 Tax=Halovibrio salipaludis TaxID=2032626 RepID=A0A2A2ETR3_9GAMM|nr:urea ABC transporter permease subunit UrtC [Halovibrio salipaludis]PAU75864.1 urea ABC transporter permease subunit UrtC [Halovibrio salipaludis]